VATKWPGSVHDSTIFDNSQCPTLFENSQGDGCTWLVMEAMHAGRTWWHLSSIQRLLRRNYRPTTWPRYKRAIVSREPMAFWSMDCDSSYTTCFQSLWLPSSCTTLPSWQMIKNQTMMRNLITTSPADGIAVCQLTLTHSYMPPVGLIHGLIPIGAQGVRRSLIDNVFN